jgi:uncharacterized repeat protein (TIGR01451 family)
MSAQWCGELSQGIGVRRIYRYFYLSVLFCVSLGLSFSLSLWTHSPEVTYAQDAPVVRQVVNQALIRFDPPTGGPPLVVESNPTQVPAIPSEPPPEPEPPDPPQPPEVAPRLQIVKTADRAAAEPGDIAVYRLLVTNISTQVADPVTITDQLPRGLRYVPDSVRAEPNPPTQVVSTDSTLTLTFGALAPNESITVVYAVLMTPDAVRGDGRNVAQASAPGFEPVVATYQITVRPGILADCGTILGRVFVDKNFDGQQQPGEPGVPNAVIFMDDGNRILTDPDGLFSLANVLPGYRVGTLDLYSLPGYTLAPNLYRIEENSVSRMARLSPGGLARMNFAVTPTFGEEQP